MAKSEGIGAVAVLLQMLESLFGFVGTGLMASGYPPKYEVGSLVFFKPLRSAFHYLGVGGFERKIPQGLDRLPNRHVDDEQVVAEDVDGRGVVVFVFEPPHEAFGLLGQFVDGSDVGHKIGNGWRINRGQESSDVELSQMVFGHKMTIFHKD